jgi:CheY-like chemotaxis protein
MRTQAYQSSRLLVIEDDLDTRELVGAFLQDEGYAVTLASSLKEARELLEKQPFHLVLTDLFASDSSDPLKSVEVLRELARPTPIGVMTGWAVKVEEVHRQGFAFLVAKPFHLDELLTTIASGLNLPLSPEQQRQAEVVKRFLATLESKNLEALAEVCTPDVRYYPPASSPYTSARKVSGLVSYRAYIENVYSYFQNVHFEEVLLYARPKGLAARYTSHWLTPDGRVQRTSAAVLFHFRGELISQIGVRVNARRTSKPPDQGAK